MKTNNPYTPFDEQLREQLASLNPEVPEGVWEAMESSLDSLNQNLQFDAAIRETVEHINIPAPEGVFQAVQSQLGSGILGQGLSIAGKWILGSVLAGVVTTSVWYMANRQNTQENSEVAVVSDKPAELNAIEKVNSPDQPSEVILPSTKSSDQGPDRNPIVRRETETGAEGNPFAQSALTVQPATPATPQVPQGPQIPGVQGQPQAQLKPKTPIFGFSQKDTMLCEGQTYKLFLLNADNCVYEVWINGSCLNRGVKGTEQTHYPMTTAGLYHMECRILDGETIHKKAQFLYVNPLPEVKLSKTDMGGGRYAFEAGQGVKTLWYLDGGMMSNGNIQLYDALPKDHRMSAQVTNKFGCTDSASLEFRNNVVFEVKAPRLTNVFTPDGDGINDGYKVDIEGATFYHIYIFNSQSQLVFESTDPKEEWDGRDKYKQNQIVPGFYTCILDYALAGGKMEQAKETITLIKE
ncbi:MAG TPA: hypothetical protein DIW47_04020 [Bacteroidetes bacterium]|nr:hypothetical protein [Bacteroidota bacterium]